MTREEALKILKDCRRRGFERNTYTVDEYHTARDMAIEALEQEPKTGHWILSDEQNEEDVENGYYRFICSECQRSDIHAKGIIVPYCWKCGAKLAESEE